MTCTPDCHRPRGQQAHCGACCQTFGSVSGFDLHRRGGECLDPATISGQRLDPEGVWRYPSKDQPYWNAHSAMTVEPQSDETGSGVPGYGSGDSGGPEALSGGPDPDCEESCTRKHVHHARPIRSAPPTEEAP